MSPHAYVHHVRLQFSQIPTESCAEPAEPDALSFAVLAHAIHAVIPVTRAHERQTVNSNIKAAVKGACAMFEQ